MYIYIRVCVCNPWNNVFPMAQRGHTWTRFEAARRAEELAQQQREAPLRAETTNREAASSNV